MTTEEKTEYITKLKKQIEYERYLFNLNNTENDLEKAIKRFDDMLTEFYEILPAYLIERQEAEKGKDLDVIDGLEWFYIHTIPHRFRDHLFKNILQKYSGENKVLDELVFKTRTYLCSSPKRLGQQYITEQNCSLASAFFQKETNDHMFSRVIATSGGFGIPYNAHAFNYVELNDTNYIVDCTVSQFSKVFRMNLGIVKIPREETSAEPIFFLLQTDKGKNLLHKLLTQGYFEATPENVKLYLDSFVLSNQNAYCILEKDVDIFKTSIESEYYMSQLEKIITTPMIYTHKFEPLMLYNVREEISDIFGLPTLNGYDRFLTREELGKINKKIKL